MSIELSVVIPLYNEEGSIEQVLADHVQALGQIASQLNSYEILCLDDGSTDHTWEILQRCKEKYPCLRLLQNLTNLGISRSFNQLFQHSSGKFIYATGGDGQWPAENLLTLYKELKESKADIVVGVRLNRNKVYKFWRKLLSYCFNKAAKIFFGINTEDANGIKLGRKEIFVQPVISKSFFAEVERLHLAKRHGFHIAFAPVLFLARTAGHEKGAKLKNIFYTVWDLIKYIFLSVKAPHIVPTIFFTILIATYGVWYFFWGETIPVRGGLGWDGELYGHIARDPYQAIIVDKVPLYFLHRILPSLLVHHTLRLLHLPFNNGSIIGMFQIYNLFFLLLIAVLWGQIIKHAKLSAQLCWVAFIALFLNYFVLKQSFYYPVLTDVFAFFLAVLLLYFYIMGARLGVLMVTLLGLLTWPVVSILGLILYSFPIYRGMDLKASSNNFSVYGSFALTLIYVVSALAILLNKQTVILNPLGCVPIHIDLIGVSLLCLVGYLFLGTKEMISGLGPLNGIFKQFDCQRFMMLGILLVLFNQGMSNFSLNNEFIKTNDLMLTFYWFPLSRPLNSFLAHILYYGPVLIIVTFVWGPLCKVVRSFGFGAVLYVFFGFLMTLDSDARHLICLYPFLILFLMKTLEQYTLTKKFIIAITVVSLFFSKIWMLINVESFHGAFIDFPYQFYYMNHGAWISDVMYLWQGGCVLLAAIYLFFLFKNANKRGLIT